MEHVEFQEKLERYQSLLKDQQYKVLQRLLEADEAIDIADIAKALPQQDMSILFRLLPKDLAADVFSHLSSESRECLLAAYSDEELTTLLDQLYNDDFVGILGELPAKLAQQVLQRSSPERRQEINRLLKYAPESAGSLMTTEFMSLGEHLTVKAALYQLRHITDRIEMIYTIFVIDADRKLAGVVQLADILKASDNLYIRDLMDDNPHYALTEDDQEAVADLFQRYDLLALPVLDKDYHPLGIITVDDIMDVISDESWEDLSRMSAVQTTDLSYPDTTIWGNYKRRIVWLMLLMLSDSLNGILLEHYQPVYLFVPFLMGIMPMLTSTGGNVAAQASSLVIVAMTTHEVTFKDLPQILWKECKVSFVNALLLASTTALIIYFILGQSFMLALSIFLSFFITILFSGVLAAGLPLLAQAVHIDPATVAAPILTTIVDLVALTLYYSIAGHFFGIY